MSEKIDRLIDEIAGCRDACEELYLLFEHAWRNREELSGILSGEAKPRSPEGMRFCCDDPNLTWNGDPDTPGVACESCGYVIAENGSLITYPAEEVEEIVRKAKERQKGLFD